jgi:hypothetical protein
MDPTTRPAVTPEERRAVVKALTNKVSTDLKTLSRAVYKDLGGDKKVKPGLQARFGFDRTFSTFLKACLYPDGSRIVKFLRNKTVALAE